MHRVFILWFFWGIVLRGHGAGVLFHEPFQGKLKTGWTWIREDPKAWRVGDKGGLEIQIQPGNMWGGENSGRNVLVREIPGVSSNAVEISMTVSNQPTEQYEQVDLVAYWDDGHMVKIGKEQVDGVISIVMGREENDRTRTLAIIPLSTLKTELKLRIEKKQVTGSFRPAGETSWRTAGRCDFPAEGSPRVAIQCYQGPKDKEHWARIENFTIASAN